jgi:hypothetical protein
LWCWCFSWTGIFLWVFLSKLYLGNFAPLVLISDGKGIWCTYFRLAPLSPLSFGRKSLMNLCKLLNDLINLCKLQLVVKPYWTMWIATGHTSNSHQVFLSKLYLGNFAPLVLISDGKGIWCTYFRLAPLSPLSFISPLSTVLVSLAILSLSSWLN